MTAAAFDTHAAVKALQAAGFDEKQAEAVTATIGDAVTEGVASKADIVRLEARIDVLDSKVEALNDKIEALDGKIDSKIEALDSKVEALDSKIEAAIAGAERRMLLAMVAVGGLVVAAVKLL